MDHGHSGGLTTRTLHAERCHHGWDNALEPVLHIRSGETVVFETKDASGGQIGPDATTAIFETWDMGLVNPVTGPVFVEGAQPGDALRITFLDHRPCGFGWTGNIPGFGLLTEDFPDPALHLWTYDTTSLAPAAYGPGGRVPLKPFVGTIGLAPAEPGSHSVIPPRRVGGNLDMRDFAKGASLTLPVEVPGALLSLGDTHAAQGDGEVCGTAIESAMSAEMKIELIKGGAPAFPLYDIPGPVSRHLDAKGYFVATGVGPDLMQAAKDAVRGMIDRLGTEQAMSAVDAYLLTSVCADLRISEIVDMPNVVVSLYFPKVVFD